MNCDIVAKRYDINSPNKSATRQKFERKEAMRYNLMSRKFRQSFVLVALGASD